MQNNKKYIMKPCVFISGKIWYRSVGKHASEKQTWQNLLVYSGLKWRKTLMLLWHIRLVGIAELGQCQSSTIFNFDFRFKPAFQTQLESSGFILHPKKYKYSPDLLENYKLKFFEACLRPLQRLVKCCSWSIH